MGTSFAAGDAFGASPAPPYRDESSAGAINAKVWDMKIVKDTIDIPLLLLPKDTLKYESSANRPVLAPLSAMRAATGRTDQSDEQWKAMYDHFVSLLPSEFRELLNRAREAPVGERSVNFVLFDQLLEDVAKGWVAIDRAAAPTAADSIASTQVLVNGALPSLSAYTSLAVSRDILLGGKEFLSQIGPNYPHFDMLSNALNTYSLLMGQLQEALQPESERSKSSLADTVNALKDLDTTLSRYYSGSEMTILKDTLQAVIVSAEALSLNEVGSSSLLMALNLGMIGAGDKQSDLKLFGPAIDTLQKALSSTLNDATGENSASGKLAGLLLSSLLWSSSAIASSYSSPLASATNSEQQAVTKEIDSANTFAYGLMLQLMDKSSTVDSFTATVAAHLTENSEGRETIAAVLKLATMLTMILSSLSSRDIASASPLLRQQGESFMPLFTTIGNYLASRSDESAQQLEVQCQQAKIALANEDDDAFVQALGDIFTTLGTSSEEVVKDAQELKETTASIQGQLAAVEPNVSEITMQG